MPALESTPGRVLPTVWELPDDLWARVEPLLESRYPRKVMGCPRADLRAVLDGIIYRMRSGVQWAMLPRRFGAKSTVHGWFQQLAADGVLEEIWAQLAAECDHLGLVEWEYQSADGVMGKSRFEGDKRGRNPTDRGKMGTKKHLLVDQSGGPLSVVVAAANVNDHLLLRETIDQIVLPRPSLEEVIQHLCLDKAYDNQPTSDLLDTAGYVPHVRRIGEEKLDSAAQRTHPARRWVVERTISWLQKCRAILIRYDKKSTNYKGLVALACALLWWRRLDRLHTAA